MKRGNVIHQAVESGDIARLAAVVKSHHNKIDDLNALGLTPMLLAGVMGRRDMVNLLINSGADYRIESNEKIKADEYLTLFDENAKHEREYRHLKSLAEMTLLKIASHQKAY